MDQYAAAGVDPAKIKPFTDLMAEVAKDTIRIPFKRRNVLRRCCNESLPASSPG